MFGHVWPCLAKSRSQDPRPALTDKIFLTFASFSWHPNILFEADGVLQLDLPGSRLRQEWALQDSIFPRTSDISVDPLVKPTDQVVWSLNLLHAFAYEIACPAMFFFRYLRLAMFFLRYEMYWYLECDRMTRLDGDILEHSSLLDLSRPSSSGQFSNSFQVSFCPRFHTEPYEETPNFKSKKSISGIFPGYFQDISRWTTWNPMESHQTQRFSAFFAGVVGKLVPLEQIWRPWRQLARCHLPLHQYLPLGEKQGMGQWPICRLPDEKNRWFAC